MGIFVGCNKLCFRNKYHFPCNLMQTNHHEFTAAGNDDRNGCLKTCKENLLVFNALTLCCLGRLFASIVCRQMQQCWSWHPRIVFLWSCKWSVLFSQSIALLIRKNKKCLEDVRSLWALQKLFWHRKSVFSRREDCRKISLCLKMILLPKWWKFNRWYGYVGEMSEDQK